MKTARTPLVAMATLLLATGCPHREQALPAPTPAPTETPTPAPPQTVTIVPTEAPPTPPPPVVEITPAPAVIAATPTPVPSAKPAHKAVRRPAPRRYVRGRITGSRYRVLRGDNLWDISQRAYGNPFRWPGVYRANRARIRNPRLIFPGQVVHLPRGMAAPAESPEPRK